MSANPPRPTDLSRRAVIGVAATVPLMPLAPNYPTTDIVLACADWMAIDMEMERLTLRWATLDAVAMRRRTRTNGLPAGRQDRVLNLEMAALDERLNMLGGEREQRLCQIAKHPASDLHGVCGKLAVAARMLDGEGGSIHQIVEEAVRVLSAQHCSGCGTRFVPDVRRPSGRL